MPIRTKEFAKDKHCMLIVAVTVDAKNGGIVEVEN